MSKLLTIVKELVEVAGEAQAFASDEHFHLKLKQENYMPLVIESWKADPVYFSEQRHISVAHYFEQNRDLVADPEALITDEGIPVHLQQVLGFTQVLSETGDLWQEANKNPGVKADVEYFLDTWAQNIRDQGWLEVAATY